MKPVAWLASALFVALSAFAQQTAPQRTILEDRVTKGKDNEKAQQPAMASEHAIDSLLSTEDLNSIRDGYVRRLAGDGCRPEVAIRVAELRWKLDENDSRGRAQNAAAQRTAFELEGSLVILAAGWYQSPTEAAPPRANREAERTRLLEFVLSKNTPAEAPPASADRTQLKAELDRLLATCHGAGQ
jgi:hypothetical protein